MKTLNDTNYRQTIKNDGIAVVEFKSPTCSHCKVMQKVLETIEEGTDNVNFYQIDITDSQKAVDEYEVKAVPTLIFLKNGAVQERKVGEIHKLIIEQSIKKLEN
jgi:thioredoxin 1